MNANPTGGLIGSVFVGTYPAAGAGTPVGVGEGIWLVPGGAGRAVPVQQPLVRLPAPTFLARHPRLPRLYATSEVADGLLTVLGPGAGDAVLERRSTHRSGGALPCHLALDGAGRWLFVAHYGDGAVAGFALDEAGDVVGPPVVLPGGGAPGPRGDRQDGPHAHSCTLSPDGRFLLVADLGTDEIRRYALGPAGTGIAPAPAGVAVRLPAGSGPRHLCFGPGRGPWRTLYATLELSAQLAVLDWEAETGSASVRAVHPLSSAEGALPSHLEPAGDGLVVGVRGPDELVTFAVRADGDLEPRGRVGTAAWPRHFARVGGDLVVSGERGDVVVRHRLGATGNGVGEPRERDEVPAPACVVDAAGWPS